MFVRAARMSQKYQFSILRKIFSCTYFVIQLFGLWPYSIDNSTRHIKYNFFKFIYSIVMPVAVLHNYVVFGKTYVQASKSTLYFSSETMETITYLYALVIIVSYISLYVEQHLTLNKMKSVYFKCLEVIELLKKYPNKSVDLKKYLVYFFIKTIAFDILNYLVFWFNMSRSSDILSGNPYLSLLLYTPAFSIRLNQNVFYGGVLLIDIIFKFLNKRVVGIVIAMDKTRKIYSKNNRCFAGKYCHLSDELDNLSKLHSKLSEATKALNSFFYFQLLLWIILQLVVLIIRCFFQYIGIVTLLSKHENYSYNVILNLTVFGITILAWFELISTAYAFESLVTEV